jgi:hypothetical protein
METIKNFIKKNFTVIVMILAVLTFFKSCGDSRELQKLRKEVQVMKESQATREDIELISNKVMFQFLLYEDDVDKNKASISDIKNKVDEIETKLNKK